MKLIENIKILFKKQLPFCIYHKPDSGKIVCISQNDDTLYILKKFSEKGFIFSPFKSENNTIIIPKNHSTIQNFSFPTFSFKKVNFTVRNVNLIKEEHKKLVKKAIDFIETGKAEKIVISRKEILEVSKFDFINVFLRLTSKYPKAFSYVWFHPKVGMWLGATPETLLQIKNKRFQIMSLAGTQEFKNSLDVIWKEKEKHEQQLVTKYIINRCTKKNIKCKSTKPYTIKAGNLLHIRTDIVGKLTESSQIEDLIKTLHPTPAVCGMPKRIAKEFILKNEKYKREFYTGFLGELNLENKKIKNIESYSYNKNTAQTNLFVNLRCMQVKENFVELYLGGGITKDSNPILEYKETELKSKVIKNVLC